MMDESDTNDPLEGFQLDDFDEDTKTLTISVHEFLLKYPDHKQALMEKVAEILQYGDEIDRVTVAKRD